jgi:hypothetical protein
MLTASRAGHDALAPFSCLNISFGHPIGRRACLDLILQFFPPDMGKSMADQGHQMTVSG